MRQSWIAGPCRLAQTVKIEGSRTTSRHEYQAPIYLFLKEGASQAGRDNSQIEATALVTAASFFVNRRSIPITTEIIRAATKLRLAMGITTLAWPRIMAAIRKYTIR